MEPVDPKETVWSVFDGRLETALNTVEVAVSVKLHRDMGHDMELIRWIEGWNLRFRQRQKALISIVEDPAQQLCLELSHPDMELVYCRSINDIPALLLKLTHRQDAPQKDQSIPVVQNDTLKPAEEQSVVQPSTMAAPPVTPDIPAAGWAERPPVAALREPAPKVPPSKEVEVQGESTDADNGSDRTTENTLRMVQDSIVEIAGEYRCDYCGTTRMFCKGAIVDRCENRECSSSSSSFSLVYDLF